MNAKSYGALMDTFILTILLTLKPLLNRNCYGILRSILKPGLQ